MGLLDSVIGALSGVTRGSGRGDMLGSVLRLLADDGGGPGVNDIIERFEQHGRFDIVSSWIARGENLPISADELHTVLGTETLDGIAGQLGLSRRVTAERLSQMLPYVLDKLTPNGRVPEGGLGDIGELMGRMARR